MKKRMLSLALAVGMTLTTLTGCGSSTGASSSEGADGSATAADPVTTAAEQLLKHSDTAGKEETVYVIADANGKANKVIVSEWLKNQKGSDTLKDQSNLKDVKNVKGDQDFTKGSGDELTWNAKGSDIYYQGTSDKQLPVDVTVTYKLNGKTVSAKELDGASGKLTMEFTYKNNTGKTKKVNGKNVTIYQPFLMVSGLLVDNDKMSNVEVTNGKVINSGDKTVVVGMALPGLEESLGLADLTDSDGKKIDIDVPQKVTIKADVSDFSLLTTVTMASNSALEELNLDDVDSVDDLKDSLKKLGDSSKELVDGTKKLEDGVGELDDKSGDLADGVDQVNQGAKDLDKGAKDLNNGAKDLDDGTNELATQVKDLPSSAQQLLDGAKSIKSALGNADSKTQTIYTGAAAIEEGAQQMSDNLKNTNGKSIYEDGQFALEVMQYINDKVNQFKKEDGNLYAIYGTPAESLCGLQIEQFRKLYGIVENVSDRPYVSNSFHCHVTEEITPIEKQNSEARFWNLSNGGKIQYVRYPVSYNKEAIRTLVRRAMKLGLYEGVNLSLAYCDDCGYQQLEMDVCPKCGSTNLTKIDRMNGYLSYSRVHGESRLNDAKMAEIAERKSM